MKKICTFLFSSMIVSCGFAQNVGIGISSPTEKLEVDGNLKLANSTKGVVLSTADAPMITRAWDPFTGGAYTGLGRWGLFMEPNRLTMGLPDLFGKQFSISAFDENSLATKHMFTVNTSGSVGVGTAFPTARFQVDNDSSLLNIQPNGNVGMGTTFPQARLDIKSSINSTPFVIRQHNDVVAMQVSPPSFYNAVYVGGTTPGIIGALNVSNSFLSTFGSPQLRVTGSTIVPSTGSAATISFDNTANSNARHNLVSYTGADDLQHRFQLTHVKSTGANSILFHFDEDDFMGIGTSNPSQKLTVQGSINSSALAGSGVRDVQVNSSGTLVVAPVTKYMNVPAYAFRTISASTADALSYSGLGGHTAVHLGTGLGSLVAPVYLPHGAVLRNMKVNYIDNSTQNISVNMTYNTTSSPTTSLPGFFTSSGASTAVRSATVSLSNVVVNNAEQSYFLIIHMAGFVPWEAANTCVHSVVIEYE